MNCHPHPIVLLSLFVLMMAAPAGLVASTIGTQRALGEMAVAGVHVVKSQDLD